MMVVNDDDDEEKPKHSCEIAVKQQKQSFRKQEMSKLRHRTSQREDPAQRSSELTHTGGTGQP